MDNSIEKQSKNQARRAGAATGGAAKVSADDRKPSVSLMWDKCDQKKYFSLPSDAQIVVIMASKYSRDNQRNLDLGEFHRPDSTSAMRGTALLKHFTKVTFFVGNYYSLRRTSGMLFCNLLIL